MDQCSGTSLRLRGGPHEYAGLLEVCHNGHWGTVCNDGYFNSSAAATVCKELGYSAEGATLVAGTPYGKGEGIIWLSGVKCKGHENSIDGCGHLQYGELSLSCYGHSQDVNIHCQCVYVCMHVYMFVCMYVRMYVCMYVRMYVCLYVCLYVCMYVCLYVCMYITMYVCIYVCMYLCNYLCTCIYLPM